MFIKINGKVYNTNTFNEVESYEYKEDTCSVTIYRNNNLRPIEVKDNMTKEEAEKLVDAICEKLQAESLDAYL